MPAQWPGGASTPHPKMTSPHMQALATWGPSLTSDSVFLWLQPQLLL